MIMGIAFAATFSNLMPKERLHSLVKDTKPIVILIINLGAPLDYSFIVKKPYHLFVIWFTINT